MKYVFLFLFFPLASDAQLIQRSALDAARKWRVETTPVNLKASTDGRVDAAFQNNGNTLLVQLIGTAKGGTVLAGERLIFLLGNDSTMTVESGGVQTAERRSTGFFYRFDYVIEPAEVAALTRHELKGFRRYSTEGYEDVFIDKTFAGSLREPARAFLEELQKHAVLTKPAAPSFPGGKATLLRFLNRNLKLDGEQLSGPERRFVLTQFSIAADGSVNDIQIKQSAGSAFDQEVLRLLKRMPNWKPATANGKPVAAVISQPLTFLQREGKLNVIY